MPAQRLTPFGGEFRNPEREAAFQAERLPETLRHTRLLFLLSACLNAAFFISDWSLYGESNFQTTFPARLVVVLIALVCFWSISRAKTFRQAQRSMIAWEWINGAAVAVLVSSHTELALFAVLMLPSIYYLAVPTAFRWTIASGIGSSVMVLFGYMLPEPAGSSPIGLILLMTILNLALFLVVSRSNRLQRMEWSATQAERRAKNELADSRAMFETLFKTVPIPLLVVRVDGTIVETNDAAVRYVGATQRSLGIRTTQEFYADPRDRDVFLARIRKDGQISNFETRIRLADGSIRTVLLAGMALEIAGEPHIISSVVDITERKASEEKIWRAASHDPLTGLPNRAYFQSRLEQDLAQAERNGSSLTLLLVDLDDLRNTNETMGHLAGDALIKEAADRLNPLIESCDIVARLGGGEFVLILAEPPSSDAAQAMVDRILTDMRRPFAHQGDLLSCQVSIGIASYPDHDRQPSDLMKDAGLALRTAKALGRGRAEIYSPDMRAQLEERTSITRDIQGALRDGQIVPFNQPKVDLKTGRTTGFEALARWHHPVHGLLTPASFLAAFEDSELSVTFGEHLLRHVAADIRRWLDAGVDCGRIAVNLSTAQFNWVGLAKRFLDILHDAGVPSERLEVEITETVFLGRNAPHVVTALRQFHESGVRIALDDFGTGYASLLHLKQFPIDDIKIDQGFVRDLENDADSTAIVLAVIQLGRGLGMNVVAEGVETAGQASFLREKGCTQAQGYLYAPPMAAAAVPDYLQQQEVRCA
ncbi:putative bifunctional diguanylate cyclase/phosphodiesterase [Microvirga lenta]|uniref:putative bifunctional diguanylate cyclase/phosphodiesterase n=1 Tax=Microvirga lenta TaxID=2881337 RepID=UPI001CFE9EC0|nr:EAL domain-containing protein [Microvirga lenta]MCB5174262.1 EAL domain-containing protein [Microvirga lenta]